MGGWKTWTATILFALTEGAKSIWPAYEPVLTVTQNTFIIPLGVVGIGSKLDKAALKIF